MNAQISLLLVGSLFCFALALTQSAQPAAASTSSNNQASHGFQSRQQQRESVSPLMTSDDQDEQSGVYEGARVMQSLAPNSPYQQERLDRIKFAMAKFLENAPQVTGGGLQLLNSRIQTRSAPYTVNDQEISSWFESALSDYGTSQQDNQRGAIQTRDEHQRLASDNGGRASASSGHKTIRNAQPVFMRLPPRFGKRSYWI